MSDSNGTRAGRKPHGQSLLANAECQPGDELTGEWPREQLAKMDVRFVERMERAFARGHERPASASSA